MVVWLRPECILAIVTSLYYCFQLVSSKTYDKFWCATEEGHHQLSCPDETALLTDISIRKIYRRTEMCEPDDHSDYLVHCQNYIDGSLCEGNKTCSIEVSSRNYIQCGGKTYAPTYFFVKYTCTQIHTMCIDTTPIRNTLYGFIVSPAYPHPMADNLKCSINIEADPSMYIELTPIQIRLQDAIKCRSEYLEIFGYLNLPIDNSSYDNSISNKDSKAIWKSYHTWCGAERSTNNPSANIRYLISSNSLYMSLQTAISKKPRYFKIRYKVVPSIVRSQYDSDGIAYDSSVSSIMPGTTSPTILSTTIVVPLVEDNDIKKLNGTVTKRTYKKEILIGVISGVILLVIAILVGIGILIFIKRRRSSIPASKSTPSSTATSAGKKNIPSPASTNNTASKSGTRSSDKAPLLEQTPAATAAKRKLVPERTVQISDVNTSRFKSSTGATTAAATTTTTTTTGQTGSTGKESSSASSEAAAISSAPSAIKPVLTAADSGIYGADLSDDVPPMTKSLSSVDPPKIYGIDLPDKFESTSPSSTPVHPVTVVVNPLNETSTPTPTNPNKTILSAIVVPNNVTMNALPNEKDIPLHSIMKTIHLDETVRSAYSSLIDATMSENEGTIASSSIVSSACQSRRTSNVKQPLLSHETNNIEAISRKATPFNPLHVILKKDANKYYTTEYI